MSRQDEMAVAWERWQNHGNWQYSVRLADGSHVIIVASRMEVLNNGALVSYSQFRTSPEIMNSCWPSGQWLSFWLLSAAMGDRSCLIDDSKFWEGKEPQSVDFNFAPFVIPQMKHSKTQEEERRAKERSRIRPSVRWKILQRDCYTCQACGRGKDDDVALHVDHVVAIAKGGTSDDENLQTLCADCNQGKGDS